MTVLAQQCGASGRMPTLFWNHGGGPMPLLGDRSQASLTQYLKGVAARLPKPTAILAVSAHWEAEKVMVSTCPAPPMLFDYYGFPPEVGESFRTRWGAGQASREGLVHAVCMPFSQHRSVPATPRSRAGLQDTTHLP